MLKSATRADIKPEEFWEMTPLELTICIETFVETHTERFKEAVTVAYLNAAWQRSKKMPGLKGVLKKIDGNTPKGKRKVQTPEEMYAVAVEMTKNLSKAR